MQLSILSSHHSALFQSHLWSSCSHPPLHLAQSGRLKSSLARRELDLAVEDTSTLGTFLIILIINVSGYTPKKCNFLFSMANNLWTLIKAYSDLCESVWMKWTDVHHLGSASPLSREPDLLTQKQKTQKTEMLNIQDDPGYESATTSKWSEGERASWCVTCAQTGVYGTPKCSNFATNETHIFVLNAVHRRFENERRFVSGEIWTFGLLFACSLR